MDYANEAHGNVSNGILNGLSWSCARDTDSDTIDIQFLGV